MQLLAAHQILIGSAIALAVIFGLRSVVHYARGGAPVDLVIVAVSLAVTGALITYFRKVRARWAEQKREEGR